MNLHIPYTVLLWISLNFWTTFCEEPTSVTHRPLPIPDEHLKSVNDLFNLDKFKESLDNILVERVVGTPNHARVRNYIVDSMKQLNWSVEEDSFDDVTPNMGTLTFTNIIAKLNPNAKRYLILACHYDSKYMKGKVFLGATDSAVPCAMLLHIADQLKDYLDDARNSDLSLMMLFFDGEEAFEEWGPKDSIYGARHLAKKWQQEKFLPKIDLLCLLDLLGAADPTFYSFFSGTDHLHMGLVEAERRLSDKGYLNNSNRDTVSKRSSENNYFQARSQIANIEDDHIPFLRRGISVLHLIPYPFPQVWHTTRDNKNVIDFNTCEDLSKVLNVFVLEYLRIPFGKNKG